MTIEKQKPYLIATLNLYDPNNKSDNLDFRETIDLILKTKLIWRDTINNERIAVYTGNFYEIYDKENGLIKHIDKLGLINYNTKERYIEEKKYNNSCIIL
jgi:hypothetical protein